MTASTEEPGRAAGTGAPDPTPHAAGGGIPVAAPPPPPDFVATEPLEYHRLYRGSPRYRWWKPLVVLLVATVSYFFLATVYSLLVMVPMLLFSETELTPEAIAALAVPDTQRPLSLLLAFGSIVLMIPAVWFAMWAVGVTPVGRSWSVAARLRWGLLGRTAGLAVVAVAAMNVLGMGLELLLGSAGSEPLAPAPSIDVSAALWSLFLVILLVPFQSAAEELVFRGLLMQVIGSWVRAPWLAILLPSVVFGFSHIYDVWGWCAVVAMALAAGWITWRTGGLEAAVSLHIVNNLAAFGFMVWGVGGETAQTSDSGGPAFLVAEILSLGLYVWLVERSFRRRGGIRTRIDLVPLPPHRLSA